MDEQDQSLNTTIKNIAQTFFKTLADIANLASAEAILAGKSLITIIQLTVIIKLLAIITWLSICGALAFYLASLQLSWAVVFLAIAALNFIALLCSYLMQLKLRKNLYFPATRRQLRRSVGKDVSNEQSSTESQVS